MTLVFGGSGDGVVQGLAGLIVGEGCAFAGFCEEQHSGSGGAGVAIDVVLELLEVDPAIGIERRGNGDENSFKEHGTIFTVRGCTKVEYTPL